MSPIALGLDDVIVPVDIRTVEQPVTLLQRLLMNCKKRVAVVEAGVRTPATTLIFTSWSTTKREKILFGCKNGR